MSSPESKTDFFKYVIHLINAAIIAYSFQIVDLHLIPFNLDQTSLEKTNFIGILFVWGIMIVGWLGYTKSINEKPHSEGTLGNIRFVVDLVISFLMLYLFILTKEENFKDDFGQAFLWVLPVIFFFYVLWDIVKNKEYPTSNRDMSNILHRRQYYTLYAFVGMIVISFVFISFDSVAVSLFSVIQIPLVYDDGYIIWKYLIFMAISSVIIAVYRKVKGNLLWPVS